MVVRGGSSFMNKWRPRRRAKSSSARNPLLQSMRWLAERQVQAMYGLRGIGRERTTIGSGLKAIMNSLHAKGPYGQKDIGIGLIEDGFGCPVIGHDPHYSRPAANINGRNSCINSAKISSDTC